jgi:hypothetical protein
VVAAACLRRRARRPYRSAAVRSDGLDLGAGGAAVLLGAACPSAPPTVRRERGGPGRVDPPRVHDEDRHSRSSPGAPALITVAVDGASSRRSPQSIPAVDGLIS